VYLSPPLGSLFLSLVLARLGHRVCMALTNVVQFSSVLIVVLFPVSVNTLYMCSFLMGLSTGCATGLCISYSGEVCEPKLRGSLTSALNVFYFAGTFFVSTAYAITDSWKKSLICSIVFPLINVVALSLVSTDADAEYGDQGRNLEGGGGLVRVLNPLPPPKFFLDK
jgi:MFS family permease